MRTPKEVRRWLRQQSWYKEWRTQIMNLRISRKERNRILRGHAGKDSINLFEWRDTIQGYDCWNSRRVELCIFYHGG
jgi:hypothetical protein